MISCQFYGKSSLGMPLQIFEVPALKDAKKSILFIGGVHGDEIEGVALCEALMGKVSNKPFENLTSYFIPRFNPDGILFKQRCNARGVDLNRNLPTKDWSKEAFSKKYPPGESPNSEPENQFFLSWLEKQNLSFIISFHSFHKYLLNVNGNCEPVASHIHKKTSYPIEDSMGYPTPGCLGTYTGLERQIPTITYELERGRDLKQLLDIHLDAVYESMNLLEE